MAELLRVEDLRVRLRGADGRPRELLHGVDLHVDAGEAVALTGPSGAGKTLTARALCGLLPAGAAGGTVSWRGRRFDAGDAEAWSRLRGRGLTLVLQDPASALDPVRRAGDQVAETVRRHQDVGRAESRRRAVALLAETRVADPEGVARAWPHELSGGQQQRVLLAAALACTPELLVADEPTASLDPTVQASVLALLDDLRRRRGMALLLISHDADLVALLTERRVALADGRVVDAPSAPAAPPAAPTPPSPAAPVLEATGVVVRYGRRTPPAVAGVDLRLEVGSVVGLAGESGCGKTSLARALTGHRRPEAGRVLLAGRDLLAQGGGAFRRARRGAQLLFQGAGGSLDPRQTAGAALREAGAAAADVPRLLAEVDLPATAAERLPHQLSGGQRQRVALARCLAARPRVLVADEPTSALDPRAAARVRELLLEAARRHGLALLLISHDLPLLLGTAGRVLVMLAGVVVEVMPAGVEAPRHPYTRALLASAPARLTSLGDRWKAVAASLPAGVRGGPSGCPHQARCSYRKPLCAKELPDLVEESQGWSVRCPVPEAHAGPLFIDTY